MASCAADEEDLVSRVLRARNAFDLFGLPPDASGKDMVKAYHRIAKQIHPDKHPDKKRATQAFQKLQHLKEHAAERRRQRQPASSAASAARHRAAPPPPPPRAEAGGLSSDDESHFAEDFWHDDSEGDFDGEEEATVAILAVGLAKDSLQRKILPLS